MPKLPFGNPLWRRRFTGCSIAWLIRKLGELETTSSNLVILTNFGYIYTYDKAKGNP